MQKRYIIIFCVVIIYALIMLIFFGFQKGLVSDNTYIIIGDNTRWKYEDEKWEDISTDDKIFSEREFTVYKNQIHQGNYFLQNYNDTWYFFDKNNESYDLYGQLFAYASDGEFNVVQFDENEPTLDELNKVLKKYDIKVNNLTELSYAKKISLDVDADEQLETIYSISNLMAENRSIDKFSVIIYVNGNQESEIISEFDDVKYIYGISNIIDFNNDQKYEIIIEHQKPMNAAQNCHSMYKLKSRKYESVKSCE